MKKDVTGLALERAVKTIMAARELVRQTISLGPTIGQPSASELQRLLQNPTPGLMRQLVEQLGQDKALELLVGAQGKKGGS